jgi:hypothetical protein
MELTSGQIVSFAVIIATLASAFYAMVKQQAKNFEKMLDTYKSQQANPEIVAILSKTLDGFDRVGKIMEGVETTINLDIQSRIKHDELNAQRFERMQESAAIQDVAHLNLLHEISGTLAPLALLPAQTERIAKLETNMKDDAILTEIRALRLEVKTMADKIDQLLAEGQTLKAQNEQVNARVTGLETVLVKRQTDEQAKVEAPVPPEEVKPTTDNQETN